VSTEGLPVEAKGIGVRFGGVRALHEVSLDVQPSRIAGLIGPNGAGKTTLLNVISGIQRANVGTVLLGAIDVRSRRPFELVEVGVSRTFQLADQCGQLTVEEFMLLGSAPRGRASRLACAIGTPRARGQEREARESVIETLTFFGLDPQRLLPLRMDVLPYGLRKRIDVARACVQRPRLLLLDEPTSGLNHTETLEFAEGI